jgi:hypothetical protein
MFGESSGLVGSSIVSGWMAKAWCASTGQTPYGTQMNSSHKCCQLGLSEPVPISSTLDLSKLIYNFILDSG